MARIEATVRTRTVFFMSHLNFESIRRWIRPVPRSLFPGPGRRRLHLGSMGRAVPVEQESNVPVEALERRAPGPQLLKHGDSLAIRALETGEIQDQGACRIGTHPPQLPDPFAHESALDAHDRRRSSFLSRDPERQ